LSILKLQKELWRNFYEIRGHFIVWT
jgi:hypothetical protein